MLILKKLFKDSFTGADGITYDIGRILWALGVLVFIFNALFALYMGQTWDPVSYGTGLGAVLVAGGAALGFKANAEPKNGT